jgi:hypothetical protein
MPDRELAYEITLSRLPHAPFDAQPFKVVVRASGSDAARIKVFRLLKRTYGDGTAQGNPMWWLVIDQRRVDAPASAPEHQR